MAVIVGDLFIRNAAVGGLLILVLLVLFSGDEQDLSGAGIKSICWAPAHFKSSHIRYANTVCSGTSVASNYNFIEETIPGDGSLIPTHRIDFGNKAQTKTSRSWKKMALSFLLTELSLVISVFFLSSLLLGNFVKNIDKNSHGEAMGKSNKIKPRYCSVGVCVAIKVLLSICFVLFAIGYSIKLQNNPSPSVGTEQSADLGPADQLPDVFLCNFKIRHQSRVHDYVVQCAWEADEALMSTNFQDVVQFGNTFICVSIALAIVFQLTLVHTLYPIIHKESLKEKLRNMGIEISNQHCMFGFSEQYISLLVANK